MKKAGKILLVVIGIAVYFNIGWVIGNYYYSNVFYTPPSQHTPFAKVFAGSWSVLSDSIPLTQIPNKLAVVSIVSVFWPLFLAFSSVTWVIYFIYYLLWLIFAGGGAKLLGLV